MDDSIVFRESECFFFDVGSLVDVFDKIKVHQLAKQKAPIADIGSKEPSPQM
jgi:hypothetical protein